MQVELHLTTVPLAQRGRTTLMQVEVPPLRVQHVPPGHTIPTQVSLHRCHAPLAQWELTTRILEERLCHIARAAKWERTTRRRASRCAWVAHKELTLHRLDVRLARIAQQGCTARRAKRCVRRVRQERTTRQSGSHSVHRARQGHTGNAFSLHV
jgi:hypothetical protein